MLDPHEANHVFTDRMDLDPNQYIIVRYRIKPGTNLTRDQTAALIAINGSLGTTLPLPYENREDRLQKVARVLDPVDEGDSVSIAYPLDMCDPSEGLTQLLSVIWYTADYNFTSAYWVDNIEFPRAFTDHYPGPKFGVEGIRKAFAIPERPILGAIIKPRRGVPLSTIIKKCEESLEGGADYIIDDELTVSEGGAIGLRNRVLNIMQAVRKAEQRTGQKKGFIASVNASPVRALDQAKAAIEAGASAILVNAFTMGFSGFEDFTRHPSVTVPVITCNMGSGILTRPSQYTGTSEAVISLLSRLAGADGVYSGISGALWYATDILRGSYAALRSTFHGKKKTMAVVAGGLNAANLWPNISIMGQDTMLQAGTGIMGYPHGPREMAFTMKKIIEEIPYEISEEKAESKLLELARRHAEVRQALQYFQFRPKKARL